MVPHSLVDPVVAVRVVLVPLILVQLQLQPDDFGVRIRPVSVCKLWLLNLTTRFAPVLVVLGQFLKSMTCDFKIPKRN